MSPRPERPWLFPLLVALAAVLPYLPVLGGTFLYDDVDFLESGIRAAPWREALRRLPHSRGLSYLTLSWDAWISGFHPMACHATNLVLHMLASLAALGAGRALLKRLGQPRVGTAALAGALLYACHPLLSGAVCYVVQRSEIMAALFAFLALRLYLSEDPWTSLIACAAGFLSKDNGLAIPALLLCATAALPAPERRGRIQVLAVALVLAGLAAIYLNPALFGLGSPVRQGNSLFQQSAFTLTPGLYLVTELGVVARYLRLAILPFGQHLDYDWGHDATLWALRPMTGLLLLLSLTVLAWRVRSNSVLPLFALGWFLLALAPSSSLVPIEDVIMEHRVTTALWGPALAAGAWLAAGTARRRALGLLMGGLLTICTIGRASTWADLEGLWRESARACPGKSRPWEGLGNAQEAAGGHRPAELNLRRALILDPLAYRAGHNLGRILAANGGGRHEEAVAAYLQALKGRPAETETSLDLGNSLQALGRKEEAVAILKQAAQASPDHALVHYNLGRSLILVGRAPEALAPLQRALALLEDPAWLRGHEGAASRKSPPSPVRAALGLALCRSGRPREAREILAPAFAAGPDRDALVSLWNVYGESSAALGDAEGVRKAREALAGLR